jgi:hypothetical protein
MKPIVAGILTAVILATMLLLGSRGIVKMAPPDEPQEAPISRGEVGASPAEEAVQGLLRSGEQGDVSGYLAAFSGPLQERLTREVGGRGRDAFADDLRRAAATRKSHAIFAAEPEGEDAARVTVETIYPDRNERQTYRVERTDDGWRVIEVATIKSHQPAAKFGSPASYIAPEGAPVQESTSPRVGVTVESGDDPDPP